MIRVEPENWLPATFARAGRLIDLLRQPVEDYGRLAPEEKDRLRQTQLLEGELARVLGRHEGHALMMKFDGTLGWSPEARLRQEPGARAFPPLPAARVSAAEFFDRWKGAPYVWGGVTRGGIDCSGFTQRYFLDVRGVVLPKNSRDQRRGGQPGSLAALKDHDLVFCKRRGGNGVHHVALHDGSALWHARLVEGVVRQEPEEFLGLYDVEEVRSFASII